MELLLIFMCALTYAEATVYNYQLPMNTRSMSSPLITSNSQNAVSSAQAFSLPGTTSTRVIRSNTALPYVQTQNLPDVTVSGSTRVLNAMHTPTQFSTVQHSAAPLVLNSGFQGLNSGSFQLQSGGLLGQFQAQSQMPNLQFSSINTAPALHLNPLQIRNQRGLIFSSPTAFSRTIHTGRTSPFVLGSPAVSTLQPASFVTPQSGFQTISNQQLSSGITPLNTQSLNIGNAASFTHRNLGVSLAPNVPQSSFITGSFGQSSSVMPQLPSVALAGSNLPPANIQGGTVSVQNAAAFGGRPSGLPAGAIPLGGPQVRDLGMVSGGIQGSFAANSANVQPLPIGGQQQFGGSFQQTVPGGFVSQQPGGFVSQQFSQSAGVPFGNQQVMA